MHACTDDNLTPRAPPRAKKSFLLLKMVLTDGAGRGCHRRRSDGDPGLWTCRLGVDRGVALAV